MPSKSIEHHDLHFLLSQVRKALRRLIEDDDSLLSGLGDSCWPLLYDELCALDCASKTFKSRLTRSIGAIHSARRSLRRFQFFVWLRDARFTLQVMVIS